MKEKMEWKPWRRNSGEESMEEISWSRSHGGATHGEGTMEEKSWRRDNEGEIMEER